MTGSKNISTSANHLISPHLAQASACAYILRASAQLHNRQRVKRMLAKAASKRTLEREPHSHRPSSPRSRKRHACRVIITKPAAFI